MKSIISRYGEMTKGLSTDSEGEEIDYNRVDTALKTVGISLKDAQGQFRNFNDVIFELADTWDTLDSVTQRYIATIFAGDEWHPSLYDGMESRRSREWHHALACISVGLVSHATA